MKQYMSNMAIKWVIICVISMLVLGGCAQNQKATDKSNTTATDIQTSAQIEPTELPWWETTSGGIGDLMVDKVGWGKNTVAIEGIIPKEEHVVIPERIRGRVVKYFDCCDAFCNEVVKSIDFPKTIKKICPDKVYYFSEVLPNLESIRFDPKNKVYACENGLFYGKKSGKLLNCMGNYQSNTLTIPKHIREIEDRAFDYQSNIERMTIRSNVKKIGFGAFAYMSNLKEVSCKGDIKILWGAEFNDCIRLRNVTLNEGLENIGDTTFENCKSLGKIVIPSTVEKIGWRAFHNCLKLRKVVFPSNIKNIGRKAFSGCESLKRVVIPKGTKLGKDAFPTTCKVVRK